MWQTRVKTRVIQSLCPLRETGQARAVNFPVLQTASVNIADAIMHCARTSDHFIYDNSETKGEGKGCLATNDANKQ